MILARALVVSSLFLVACGSSKTPAQDTPPESTAAATTEPTSTEPVTTAEATAAPTASASAAPAAAAAPTAELSGSTIKLSYDGKSYTLSNSAVFPQGKSFELHFEEPMDKGYNQIWLMPQDVKKGQPAKVDGFGMAAVFLQLAEGTEKVRNVSNSCSASGTVTFAEVPKAGAKSKGSVDVTITCKDVPGISGPIVIKGEFADLPFKK